MKISKKIGVPLEINLGTPFNCAESANHNYMGQNTHMKICLPTLDFTFLIHIGTYICIFIKVTQKIPIFRETYPTYTIFNDINKLYPI